MPEGKEAGEPGKDLNRRGGMVSCKMVNRLWQNEMMVGILMDEGEREREREREREKTKEKNEAKRTIRRKRQ